MTQPTIDIDRPHEVITTGWWAEAHAQFNLTLWGDLRMYMLGGTMTGESFMRLEFSPMIGMAGSPLVPADIRLDFPLTIGMQGGGRSLAEFTAVVADPLITMNPTSKSVADFALDLDLVCGMHGQNVHKRGLDIACDLVVDMSGSGNNLAEFELDLNIDVAMQSDASYTPAAFDLSLDLDFNMDSLSTSTGSFELDTSVNIAMYSGSLASATMYVDLFPDVAIIMEPAATHSAEFDVNIGDPVIGMQAVEVYDAELSLDLDLNLDIGAVAVPQLTFDIETIPDISMQTASKSTAEFELAVTPALQMDQSATSTAAVRLEMPDPAVQFDTYLRYDNAFTLEIPIDMEMLMEQVIYQANMSLELDIAVGMEALERYARSVNLPLQSVVDIYMSGAGKQGALPAAVQIALESFLSIGMNGFGINPPVEHTVSSTSTIAAPSWWRMGVDYVDVIGLGGGGGGGGYNMFTNGAGGSGGNYSVITDSLVGSSAASVYVLIGTGGNGSTSNGSAGGTTYVRKGTSSGTAILTATGGSGGSQSGNSIPGKSPGNRTYQDMTLTGGAAQNTAHGNGNPPGGGGAGSNAGFNSGGNGAAGQVKLRWRQLGWS